MTKTQILNFLKAPFGKSFIVAYLFTLPTLLIVPLISKLISFIVDHHQEISAVSEDEIPQFILSHFAPYWDKGEGIMALVGLCTAVILLSVYLLGLTHKTVAEGAGIFDASRLSLSVRFIGLSFLKYIGVLAAMSIVSALTFLPLVLFGFVGMFLNIQVLVAIIGFFALFFLGYKLICYLYTANILFMKEFKVKAYLNYAQVKTYFITHKKNIFIGFLLSYVSGQMINLIFGSALAKIVELTITFGAVMAAFHLSTYWVIGLGFLVLNFVWAYLMTLHGIVCGKIILWIERNQE
ncbi:MAG: hypothetical protein IJV07_01760 [Alphaproteobacteria bacterium]|nr:hypothetical protein [Alphaproteobacteria bacterium]